MKPHKDGFKILLFHFPYAALINYWSVIFINFVIINFHFAACDKMFEFVGAWCKQESNRTETRHGKEERGNSLWPDLKHLSDYRLTVAILPLRLGIAFDFLQFLQFTEFLFWNLVFLMLLIFYHALFASCEWLLECQFSAGLLHSPY